MLRKQRLELNNLLKERERLLEAQHKLSNLASQPVAVSAQTQTNVASPRNKKSNNFGKQISFPALTKEELSRQEKYKQNPQKSLLSKFAGANVKQHYGSEHDYFRSGVMDDSDDKELMAGISCFYVASLFYFINTEISLEICSLNVDCVEN